MRKYFDEVWKLHQEWGKGILYKDVVHLTTATVLLSDIAGIYYNFAVPTVDEIDQFDLDSVKEVLERSNNKVAIFLLEHHLKNGFAEYLIRHNFKFEGRDTWMGYDKESYRENKVNSNIVLVTPELFRDYSSVLGKVFTDFPGNATYLEICRKTITGGLRGSYPNLTSELYLIYEKNKPVAGAGMFYSDQGNFAYLHDAGTLEESRGKGYQSDLIKFRVNRAIDKGIGRIYSSVDHGGKSWSNSIKCGLNQMHTGQTFVLNK